MKLLDKGKLLTAELSASQAGRIEALKQQFRVAIDDWGDRDLTLDDIARHFATWTVQVIDSFLAELFIQEVFDERERSYRGRHGEGPDDGGEHRGVEQEAPLREELPPRPGEVGGPQQPMVGPARSNADSLEEVGDSRSDGDADGNGRQAAPGHPEGTEGPSESSERG